MLTSTNLACESRRFLRLQHSRDHRQLTNDQLFRDRWSSRSGKVYTRIHTGIMGSGSSILLDWSSRFLHVIMKEEEITNPSIHLFLLFSETLWTYKDSVQRCGIHLYYTVVGQLFLKELDISYQHPKRLVRACRCKRLLKWLEVLLVISLRLANALLCSI